VSNEYAKHFRGSLASLLAKQVHSYVYHTQLFTCFAWKIEIACLQAFWEFVKDIAYGEKEKNAKELHHRIIRAAKCVTNEMIANIWWETEYYLET
jgi:hypothetical protein